MKLPFLLCLVLGAFVCVPYPAQTLRTLPPT